MSPFYYNANTAKLANLERAFPRFYLLQTELCSLSIIRLRLKCFCTQTAESYFSSSLDIVHVFPTEIIFLVFDWLDLESLCLCRSVSRTWRKHVNGYLGSLFCLDFVPHQSVLTEDGLRHMLKSVSNLRVLHVDNCWLSVTEENLFLIAQNCSKLSVLTASRCKGVTDVGLKAIARQCKELAEVDLSSCFTVCE